MQRIQKFLNTSLFFVKIRFISIFYLQKMKSIFQIKFHVNRAWKINFKKNIHFFFWPKTPVVWCDYVIHIQHIDFMISDPALMWCFHPVKLTYTYQQLINLLSTHNEIWYHFFLSVLTNGNLLCTKCAWYMYYYYHPLWKKHVNIWPIFNIRIKIKHKATIL